MFQHQFFVGNANGASQPHQMRPTSVGNHLVYGSLASLKEHAPALLGMPTSRGWHAPLEISMILQSIKKESRWCAKMSTRNNNLETILSI